MADLKGDGLVARENEDEDSGLSMLDVLEEEQELEDVANAVLGDSDDKNCTYNLGYVPRQALYACVTCTSEDSEVFAGICLACSYECHEGHELIELYTKRNFCCDCGNSKFSKLTCKLSPEKAAVNENNKYDQNFHGVYCTCSRPYPDPQDTIEDEMIQCIVCEDWFHGRHLDAPKPEGDYDEMICGGCVSKYSFLHTYAPVNDTKSEETTGSVQDVKQSCQKSPKSKSSHVAKNRSPERSPARKCSNGSRSLNGQGSCVLRELQQRNGASQWKKGAIFMPDNWRASLCRCSSCQDMYSSLGLSYLPSEADTIKTYENRGKAKTINQYENGMKVLSDMDRVQQVEMLTEFNGLKSELKDYLKKFADNKKVVREEDIREFFAGLSARKKQKTSTAAMQYFCK